MILSSSSFCLRRKNREEERMTFFREDGDDGLYLLSRNEKQLTNQLFHKKLQHLLSSFSVWFWVRVDGDGMVGVKRKEEEERGEQRERWKKGQICLRLFPPLLSVLSQCFYFYCNLLSIF
jgi:hypothetical protein